MRFKSFVAAVGAVSLIAAPTMATAQSAAPAPQSESVEGSEVRGGFLLPLAIIIAIIIGVLLLTRGGDEGAVSP